MRARGIRQNSAKICDEATRARLIKCAKNYWRKDLDQPPWRDRNAATGERRQANRQCGGWRCCRACV